MFRCPVRVWVIEQHAIILSAIVRSPTVDMFWNWGMLTTAAAITETVLPIFKSSLFATHLMIGCSIFKWVAETWQDDNVPGYQ